MGNYEFCSTVAVVTCRDAVNYVVYVNTRRARDWYRSYNIHGMLSGAVFKFSRNNSIKQFHRFCVTFTVLVV